MTMSFLSELDKGRPGWLRNGFIKCASQLVSNKLFEADAMYLEARDGGAEGKRDLTERLFLVAIEDASYTDVAYACNSKEL